MKRTSVGWLALCIGVAGGVTGCASLRQGESTSRCTDCATALYRDTGTGGSIYNLAAAGEEAVERVARRYCKEHGLGQPTIGGRYASSLGRDFWQYDFSCAAQAAAVAQQPTGAPAPQDLAPQLPPATGAAPSPQSAGDQASEASVASPEQQRRQQQREQAVRVMRLALAALPAEAASGCASPVTMTVRLACGEVVSCTKTGGEIHCD